MLPEPVSYQPTSISQQSPYSWLNQLRDWRFWLKVAGVLAIGGIVALSLLTQTWPLLIAVGGIMMIGGFSWKKSWFWQKKGKQAEEVLVEARVEEDEELAEIGEALEALYEASKPSDILAFEEILATGTEEDVLLDNPQVLLKRYASYLRQGLLSSSDEEWEGIYQNIVPFFIATLSVANIHVLDISSLAIHALPKAQQSLTMARFKKLMYQIRASQIVPLSLILHPKDEVLLSELREHDDKRRKQIWAGYRYPEFRDKPASLTIEKVNRFMSAVALPWVQRTQSFVKELWAQWMNVFAQNATADVKKLGVPNPYEHRDERAFFTSSMQRHVDTLHQMADVCEVREVQPPQVSPREREAQRIVALYAPIKSDSSLLDSDKFRIAKAIVEDATFLADSPDKQKEFNEKSYAAKLRYKKAYFYLQTQASEAFECLNRLPSANPQDWETLDVPVDDRTDEEVRALIPLPPGDYSTEEEWGVSMSQDMANARELTAGWQTLLEERKELSRRASVHHQKTSLLDQQSSLLHQEANSLHQEASSLHKEASSLLEKASSLEQQSSLLDQQSSLLHQDSQRLVMEGEQYTQKVKAVGSSIESLKKEMQELTVAAMVGQRRSSVSALEALEETSDSSEASRPSVKDSVFAQPHAMFGGSGREIPVPGAPASSAELSAQAKSIAGNRIPGLDGKK